MTEIILVRHGETAWNAEGRMQGHLDIPLNEAGLAQAAALGERLSSERLHAIYSSDLSRAYRTATAIAAHDGRAIQRDQRLREQHYGVLQGLTHAEAKSQQPAAWKAYRSRMPDVPLQGGEMLRVFFERVRGFLLEVCERHAGERVLLVTHGGVLGAAYRHVTGMALESPRNFPILNASINVISWTKQRWTVERWGDVGHLPNVVFATSAD